MTFKQDAKYNTNWERNTHTHLSLSDFHSGVKKVAARADSLCVVRPTRRTRSAAPTTLTRRHAPTARARGVLVAKSVRRCFIAHAINRRTLRRRRRALRSVRQRLPHGPRAARGIRFPNVTAQAVAGIAFRRLARRSRLLCHRGSPLRSRRRAVRAASWINAFLGLAAAGLASSRRARRRLHVRRTKRQSIAAAVASGASAPTPVVAMAFRASATP